MKNNAHVVVGIDFSENGDLALDCAFGISADSGGEVHAIHVMPALSLPIGSELGGEMARQQVEQHIEVTAERLRLHVQSRAGNFALDRPLRLSRLLTHVRVGSAAESIAALAAEVDADLAVVGTRGRRGVSRLLLGSVAELTTRLARCPVLVVRPKHHEIGMERVPKIEPPCPRCVEARVRSGGASTWCDQHSRHHGLPHHYHHSDRMQDEVSMPLVMPMR